MVVALRGMTGYLFLLSLSSSIDSAQPYHSQCIYMHARGSGAGSSGVMMGGLPARVNTRSITRRDWFDRTAVLAIGGQMPFGGRACAEEGDAENPEEVSGLVILRVAEVAAFQEKVLRGVAAGQDMGIPITPQQIAYGTGILLKNSNLDGNMKLMIETEVPQARRKEAVKNAIVVMNTFNRLTAAANTLQDFSQTEDLLVVADLYSTTRAELAAMFAYLPQEQQERYFGYASALKTYEDKLVKRANEGKADYGSDALLEASEGNTGGGLREQLKVAQKANKKDPPAPAVRNLGTLGSLL